MPTSKCSCCVELAPLVDKLQGLREEEIDKGKIALLDSIRSHVQNVLDTCDREKAEGKIHVLLKLIKDTDTEQICDITTLAWSHSLPAMEGYKKGATRYIDPSTTLLDIYEVEEEVK